MKIKLIALIALFNVQLLSGQDIGKIKGSWIQCRIEKKDTSQLKDKSNSHALYLKYIFTNSSVSIHSFPESSFLDTPFEIHNNVLLFKKGGNFQNIEILNDSVMVTTDLPKNPVPDDQLNRYYYLKEDKYFENLYKNNFVKVIGDSLIVANRLFSPIINSSNSLAYYIREDLQSPNIEGVADGFLIIDPHKNVINSQITKSINIMDKYQKKIIESINKTSGKWILPELGKSYYYEMDFAIKFMKGASNPFIYYFSKDTTNISFGSFRIIAFEDKKISEYYFNKGLKLAEKNKYEMAVTLFSKAIKHDSTAYGAYFNRAYCYYQMQKVNEACFDWLYLKNMGQKESKQLFIKNCKDFENKR